MIRQREQVYVDSGGWIALAVQSDALHQRAKETWQQLNAAQARFVTGAHLVIETSTFLQRNVDLDAALRWMEAIERLGKLRIVSVEPEQLKRAQPFMRRGFAKLSMADAVSFVQMKSSGIRWAFTFDHHFSSAGFSVVG